MEGGLTASFEKIILDVEMLQMIAQTVQPIRVDAEEVGLDAIAGVPTGGHFFGAQHTMARYETAFYQPLLSNWQNYESWKLAGGLDTTQRATAIWQHALKVYEEPILDVSIREHLDDFLARRKLEINLSPK